MRAGRSTGEPQGRAGLGINEAPEREGVFQPDGYLLSRGSQPKADVEEGDVITIVALPGREEPGKPGWIARLPTGLIVLPDTWEPLSWQIQPGQIVRAQVKKVRPNYIIVRPLAVLSKPEAEAREELELPKVLEFSSTLHRAGTSLAIRIPPEVLGSAITTRFERVRRLAGKKVRVIVRLEEGA